MNSILENPEEHESLIQYLDNKADNAEQVMFRKDFYTIFFYTF